MSSSVPAELTDACADLRLASNQDVVCGQPAKYVAESGPMLVPERVP